MNRTDSLHNMLAIPPIVLSLFILLAAPAFCDDEEDAKTEAPTPHVVSIEGFNSGGHDKEFSLGTASFYADRNSSNLDQAITLCHKALEKNDDDIDLHEHYAELLEQKFNGQEKPDPTLYMDCAKEWLIVLRNEAGDEDGQTFHGIGIPFSGKFYRDEGHQMLARKHLISLTGEAPKGWETDAKYLQRISKHSSVGGKVLPKVTSTKTRAKVDAAL
jgi:hypothetical protein